MNVDRAAETALNRICPYFTMFPLRFPYGVLRRNARPGQRVVDPFCGRGTTNYAARLLGIVNTGIDSSPVAVAVAAAKVSGATPAAVLAAYDELLAAVPDPDVIPDDEFWRLCFHEAVLEVMCRLRTGLAQSSDNPGEVGLRAILLGALHGPRRVRGSSYLSNQAPRTYAPKPRYSVGYWRRHRLAPEAVDVREIVQWRAERYFGQERAPARGSVLLGDSRDLTETSLGGPIDLVITSPPYYGLRTYVPDQWLRNWFLGGPPQPDYRIAGQLQHTSPEDFAADLRTVWLRLAQTARPEARMCIRFGGIGTRKADPRAVFDRSIRDSGWTLQTVRPAGSAMAGRRQALHFGGSQVQPRMEFDAWLRLS